MKTSYLFKHSNYLTRIAIVREQKQFIQIAFAVHLFAVISAKRYRSDSGALKSAVSILVYFYIIIINKYRQSAAQSCLRKKLSLSEIPTDRTFGNRRSRYKELGKKVPQGVSGIRRGNFFAVRRRRCPHIFKRRDGAVLLWSTVFRPEIQ